MSLLDKNVLITGAARRIGRSMAVGLAKAGANIIIHHGHSPSEAKEVSEKISALGRSAHIIQSDFEETEQVNQVISKALQHGPLYALVNNASIFDPLSWDSTDLTSWQRHLDVNLTAPFLLSQAFFRTLPKGRIGRIVNILDWRALRPGSDHLPYSISKAALAALTRSLAIAFAPNIPVNGIAFGAILPPSDGAEVTDILDNIPANRWAKLDEVNQALIFLLDGPSYITGEIIHLDGGRHLI